ncbi:hypothetical protein KC19_VG089800 [Ceratodon purpureus]|uniref:Uncharacterized protein n=1 Tax=Ceratodon purpureus TaxID=3225 RepID=A0A8T0HNZ3_CERPU|nr:hypothetical protein KC19_VG089800 [Ceratodon purpureus]
MTTQEPQYGLLDYPMASNLYIKLRQVLICKRSFSLHVGDDIQLVTYTSKTTQQHKSLSGTIHNATSSQQKFQSPPQRETAMSTLPNLTFTSHCTIAASQNSHVTTTATTIIIIVTVTGHRSMA